MTEYSTNLMMIIRPSPDRFIISLYHTTEYFTNLIIHTFQGASLPEVGGSA
jgi:hypothetical protein